MKKTLPKTLSAPLASLILILAFGLWPGFSPSVPSVQAYPQPAVVSPSWNLDFTHKKPTPIAYQGLNGGVRWYWFMPYKVVNHSDADQMFIPQITIYTDQGQILQAGTNVPPGLFAQIKSRLHNSLLKSPAAVVGKLLQGEDYARQSVAIWPATQGDVDHFRIFIAGLSGETQRVRNPITGKTMLLRRTLMLKYRTPGNYATPRNQPVIFAGKKEVMR